MKRQTKKLNSKKIIQVVTMLILCLILVFACIFGYSVYKDTAAFDSKKLLSSGASVMYDSNGDIMYTYGSQENGTRKNVTYDDLPQVLVDAIVAAEDSRFFEHNGFDLPRIVKAALSNLKAGGITGGGSTITQQLIKKTYFPDAQKTYSRKLSEIILAIQADKALSKEEILTLYLNKIYFGRSTSSIGIAAATKYYFNKDVSELTLPEAAMLAGSLNSPYNYDPYYCLDKATARRNTILKLMVTHGYITQQEYEEAKREYDQIKYALKMVKQTGYGVATPSLNDMKLETPEIIKQGPRYGVKLKAIAPSIHMIRVDVNSTFEPIIGSETQSKELIDYLMRDYEHNPSEIWKSEIFGRSLDNIVQEGIQSKIAMMPDNIRYKLQQTLTKVVNKGSSNMIAIVL